MSSLGEDMSERGSRVVSWVALLLGLACAAGVALVMAVYVEMGRAGDPSSGLALVALVGTLALFGLVTLIISLIGLTLGRRAQALNDRRRAWAGVMLVSGTAVIGAILGAPFL